MGICPVAIIMVTIAGIPRNFSNHVRDADLSVLLEKMS